MHGESLLTDRTWLDYTALGAADRDTELTVAVRRDGERHLEAAPRPYDSLSGSPAVLAVQNAIGVARLPPSAAPLCPAMVAVRMPRPNQTRRQAQDSEPHQRPVLENCDVMK
jgi:hypothetical protein